MGGGAVTWAANTGRIRRRGAWRVPRTLHVESEYGRINLDLSRAVIENPVVDIELKLRFGRATIIVPRDAVVDTSGLRTVWKHPIDKTSRGARSGGPLIRISGSMEFGRLRIRHRRL